MRNKLLVLISILTLLPLVGQGQVENPSSSVSINDNSVKITQAGTYTITGTGEATTNTIKIECSDNNTEVNVTIENVNISIEDNSAAPFDIVKGKVNLTFRRKNTLNANTGMYAGLHVAENTSLTITDGSNGYTLNAYGGFGAGIGSNTAEVAGAITINGGGIQAESKDHGAGEEEVTVAQLLLLLSQEEISRLLLIMNRLICVRLLEEVQLMVVVVQFQFLEVL